MDDRNVKSYWKIALQLWTLIVSAWKSDISSQRDLNDILFSNKSQKLANIKIYVINIILGRLFTQFQQSGVYFETYTLQFYWFLHESKNHCRIRGQRRACDLTFLIGAKYKIIKFLQMLPVPIIRHNFPLPHRGATKTWKTQGGRAVTRGGSRISDGWGPTLQKLFSKGGGLYFNTDYNIHHIIKKR